MPVQPDPRGSIWEGLSLQFRENSDSVVIAGDLARILQAIETTLTPILGIRGVAALVQRSLHVARIAHPWLAEPIEVAQPTLDLAALRSAVASRDRAEAQAAAMAVLQSFHDLLASLIGGPLTERLLEPVWAQSLRSPDAQDISP